MRRKDLQLKNLHQIKINKKNAEKKGSGEALKKRGKGIMGDFSNGE